MENDTHDSDEYRDLQRSKITTDQRERIVQRLSESYAHSHIDDDEFERRLSEAHRVTSHSALLALVADLPVPVEYNRPPEVQTSREPVRESETFVAILGGSERRGPWLPARRSKAIAVMGGVDLDYRNALMPPGVTEVSVFCVMGGVDIIVPPGMNVEVSGVPLLGGIDNRSGTGSPDGPTLRVSGVVVLGGIDVREKRPRK